MTYIISDYCLPVTLCKYRGGKMKAARLMWQGMGDVHSYFEPFGGRLDCLLCRPPSLHRRRYETVGDRDSYLVNFFRAAKYQPQELSRLVDTSDTSEQDLKAVHVWCIDNAARVDSLVNSSTTAYDLEAAFYTIYKFCHLLDQQDSDTPRKGAIPTWSNGLFALRSTSDLFSRLSARLQGVDVLCNDWEAILDRLRKVRKMHGDFNRTWQGTPKAGRFVYGAVVDPPYPFDYRGTFYRHDSDVVSDEAFKWANDNGDDPRYRIVFCTFAGSYVFPKNWTEIAWNSNKCSKGNKWRERLFFSPHCLPLPEVLPDWCERVS